MTTSVKVTAHCGTDKEVRIVALNDDGAELTCVILQDGESEEVFAYDNRRIVVREVQKVGDEN